MIFYSSLINIFKLAIVNHHLWFNPISNIEIKHPGKWHMELLQDYHDQFGISKEVMNTFRNPYWDDHFHKLAWNNGWLRIIITKKPSNNELNICGTNLSPHNIKLTIYKYAPLFDSDFNIFVENGITYSNIRFSYSQFLDNESIVKMNQNTLTNSFV